MKIILVITDAKGKNLVFSTDALKAYSLDESIKLAKRGGLESVHVVETGQGSYLRSNLNEVDDDNLDVISISSYKLFLSKNDIKYLMSKDGSEAYTKYLSNRPEIIGTLYSWKLGTPKPNPGSSPRGLQIAQEFYPLAKNILES